MWRLVPALVREMGQAYPELVRGEALITETLKLEETRFRKTLARGLGAARRGDARRSTGRRQLDGETAFKLYDTYGFPLDLTQDALRQRGICRRSSPASTPPWSGRRPRRARTGRAPARRRPRRSGSPCASSAGATEFLGYDTEQAEGDRPGAGRGRRERRRAPARATRSRWSSTRRRSTPSPAARWATPASISGEGVRASRSRHAEEGRRPVRPHRQGARAARVRTAPPSS